MKRIIYGLFATLLIGLFSDDAGAAIAVGAKRIDHFSSVTTATTTGITTAASGSTFVVAVSFDHTTHVITGISDSKSNTYTLAGTAGDFGSVYYCSNCTGGASHTVTITFDGAEYPIVHFLEITGAATSSYDSAVTAKAEVGSSPFTVTSGTSTQNNELIFSFIASNSGNNPVSYSESSGFTIQQQDGDGGNYWTSAVATKIVSATGTFAPSYTGSGISGSTNIVIGIKEASGGSGTTASPSTASLVLTGATPSVAVTNNKTASPSTATLALTGATPTVTTSGNKLSTPSTASLALTGATPSLTVQNYTWYTLPNPGGYDSNSILAGQSYPTGSWLRVVTDWAHITSNYATGPLQNDINDYSTAASGYTGSDSATYEIKTPALSTSQYTVTATISGSINIGPSTASLSLTGATPAVSISNNKLMSPTTAALAFTGATPSATVTSNQFASPVTASLTLTGATPTVSASSSALSTPSAASLSLTGAALAVSVTNNKTVSPSTAALVLNGAAPTIATTQNVVVQPATAVLAFSTPPPVVLINGQPIGGVTRPGPAIINGAIRALRRR